MSFVSAFIAVSGTDRSVCVFSNVVASGPTAGYEYYKWGSSGNATNIWYRVSDASLCVSYDPSDSSSKPLLFQTVASFPHTRNVEGYVVCTISKAWKLDVTKQTGGTISVSTGSDKVAVGTNYVESNVAVTLQVDSLRDGYVFSGWYLNGTLVRTDPTYSFTTGTADAAVQARFRYTRHTLTVTPFAPGSTIKVEVDTGSGYVTLVEALTATLSFSEIPENASVRMTPTVAYYATFSNWSSTVFGIIYALNRVFSMPASDTTEYFFARANETYTLAITNATPTYGSFVVRRQSNSEIVYTDNGSGTSQNVTLYKGVYYETLATASDALLYIFDDWVTGATHDSTNPLVLYVPVGSGTTSIARSCNFIAVPTYTITANVSDTSTYTPGNAAETAGNTVTVVTAPNSGSEYVKNTLVRVVASSVGQWTFTGWHIAYGGGGTTDLPGNQTLDFQISDDTTLTAIFVPTKYTVELTLDAVTTAAFAGTVELQESDLTPLSNPDSVIHGTLLRAVATAASGYTFEGWYKAGVKIEGAASTYYFTVVENTTLQAKFSAPVPLSVSNTGGSNGAAWFVTAEGVNIAQAPTTINVILGENFYIKYVIPAGTIFRGFDDDSTPVFTDQATNPIVGTCVDTGHDYTVSFDATSGTLVYLRMTNDPPGVENTGLGSLLATGCVAEISRDDYITAMGMFFGSGGDPTDGPGRNRYFSFEKYAVGTLFATPLTDRMFKRWLVKTVDVVDGAPSYGGETELSKSNPADLLMFHDLSVLAEWASGTPSRVSALYATGYNSTYGTILLSPTGLNRVSDDLGVSAEFVSSDTVVLSAVPANGYKFVGWYSDAAATSLVTASATLTLTEVEAAVTRYAKFAQDANAVYVWEGGTVPKYQTWRSKRLEASAPFDPACVRVLADGYPVVLKIYACSSPNSPSPTVPTKSVTLMNQDGMRLPSARKERYFEIEVSSSYAVNDIVMSTSMGGLTQ